MFGQNDTASTGADDKPVPATLIDSVVAPDTASVGAVPSAFDTVSANSDTSKVTLTDSAKATIPDTSAGTQVIDTTPKPVPPKKLFAQFDTAKLVIAQGEIISKTLQVINGTEKEQIFSINITYPGGWKTLTNPERLYTVEPGDTLFIPIRIVPQGKILGNTKYLIFAYIINENKVPVASAHFLTEKQKIVDWSISIIPDEKLYLLNDQTDVDFSVNLFNNGNEQLELLLDMTTFRKDRLMLMDTSERILKKPIYNFTLQTLQDTGFNFRVKHIQGMRHYRLIDTETYLPLGKGEYQKYSLFAKSRESALTGDGSVFKGKKIDLIRLSDNHKVNPYGYTALPLIMEANVTNILGYQPLMNIMFRGNTMLNNGAILNYNATTYFSTYFLGKQFLTGSFFNLGYYDKKFNIQIGNVGGGFGGGAGKGISGNYFINNQHTVGGFFTRGPRFFSGNNYSFGLTHGFTMSRFRIQSDYSRSILATNSLTSDYFRTNSTVNLNPKNTIGFGGLVYRSVIAGNTPLFGFGFNGSYSARFTERINSSVSFSYATRNVNIGGVGGSWGIRHSSNFLFKKNWGIRAINFFQKRDSISSGQKEQIVFNNTVNFNNIFKKVSVTPSIFYNYTNYNSINFHSRGVILNYSHFDFETNRLVGVNLTAGYNKLPDFSGLKDFFFFRSFLVFKYRVWSGNIRYTYGTVAATDLSFLNGLYPQTVGASLNYQHQFKNPHFILNNNLTYNYINRFARHSIGYTPQLFFFTNSGWRFYVQPGYYMGISKASNPYGFARNSQDVVVPKTSVTHSFIINAGVKKEFGIPIPWIKTKFPTLIFLAFIDHNGNNKQDEGEIALENIVIKMGDWEILSNEKGRATLQNVYGDSSYAFSAFSLVDLNGYFPNMPAFITTVKDSIILVPFVKGVKIHGNVYLDREKLSPGAEKSLDLTGIKITALNGKSVHTLTDVKGDFSFYVPFGNYTITMDEKVLGDRFTILQNNIELELDQKTESIFLTFYIVEKRRKITVKKFNGNGQRVEGSDTTITPKPKTLEELKKEEELKKQKEGLSPGSPDGKKGVKEAEIGKDGGKSMDKKKSNKQDNKTNNTASNDPIDKSQIKFKVQIGAYGSDVPSDIVEKIKLLPDIKESTTEEGLVRYTAGEFNDYDSAAALRQELLSKGISTDTIFVIIIADYKGRVFSADEAKELLKD